MIQTWLHTNKLSIYIFFFIILTFLCYLLFIIIILFKLNSIYEKHENNNKIKQKALEQKSQFILSLLLFICKLKFN